ncbi:Cobalt-zinc-cadmium resistance protein CzcD [Methylophaga thiooxydans]|jgi:Co/Zn/Cd efflux system component|nr:MULTISPECIES: cation transporter [Methylophaga]KGM07678.1 Cobalt-zinc-cadmium resistance protein CzcD [Methylophaga thiooxydans]|tara:strand:- start:8054 stop:8878 length:825 start_codon:yes stop_codon:yes gene_type:complete
MTEYSYVSEYKVPKMDCPSEEGMIRMALDGIEPGVILEFDTPNRKVRIFHGDNATTIESRMQSLDLGATLEKTEPVLDEELTNVLDAEETSSQQEAGILKWLLAINAILFVTELFVGWWAESTGLIADSLDMFADAAVYGVSLYAVGYSANKKLRAAHFSGWLQLILAVGVLAEVLRRFLYGSEPLSSIMIMMGLIALAANVTCLLLIAKKRHAGAHMKASWIFSANDVIANSGVILAGLLVSWTGSHYPDLIIGLVIGLIVMNGARRILQLRH